VPLPAYSVVKEPSLRARRSNTAFQQRFKKQKPGAERRASPSTHVGTDSLEARLPVYPVFVTDLTPSLARPGSPKVTAVADCLRPIGKCITKSCHVKPRFLEIHSRRYVISRSGCELRGDAESPVLSAPEFARRCEQRTSGRRTR